ncbi:Uncharacterised protein [uncultured Blautia sp.]|nr:Uncharacterised protein [uncultured Blautia sp.]
MLPGHLLGAEGQYDGDDGAEGLRNGGHCQGHGKEEGVHHILAPQEHTDGKEEGADDQNADGELAAELVQAHLKRGLFLLRALQQGGDPAHLCVHTGGCHQEPGPAVGDEAAGEHHVLAHLGGGGGHLLQAVQGRGGLHRLHRAQYGVHGDDRQDDRHALHIPQDGGDDGG